MLPSQPFAPACLYLLCARTVKRYNSVQLCLSKFSRLLKMFSVVATKNKRNSKQLLAVVPSSWVGKKSIYWPPSGLVTLSKDPESVPDKTTWKMSRAKVLGQAESHAEAEILLSGFQNQTESEWTDDTELSGPPKPKKGKFESKSYTLASKNDTVKKILFIESFKT